MSNIILSFAQSLGYVGVVAVFLLVTKFLSDRSAIKADYDADWLIEEENNNAVAFRRGGLYLGTAIGMFGALVGASSGFFTDMVVLSADGVMIVMFMLIARRINDWFVIHGIDNNKAVKEGNTAVGVVEAGGYIATGIIAFAVLSGTGGPWWSSLVYFALGQATLLLVTVLYEYIAPYAVVKDIREGNLAAGTMLACMLIAFSLVLRGAIAGPFTSWTADLTSFVMSTGAGIVMIVLLFNKLIDKFFFKGTDIRTEIERDQNVAAIIIAGAIKIALALIISAVVI